MSPRLSMPDNLSHISSLSAPPPMKDKQRSLWCSVLAWLGSVAYTGLMVVVRIYKFVVRPAVLTALSLHLLCQCDCSSITAPALQYMCTSYAARMGSVHYHPDATVSPITLPAYIHYHDFASLISGGAPITSCTSPTMAQSQRSNAVILR